VHSEIVGLSRYHDSESSVRCDDVPENTGLLRLDYIPKRNRSLLGLVTLRLQLLANLLCQLVEVLVSSLKSQYLFRYHKSSEPRHIWRRYTVFPSNLEPCSSQELESFYEEEVLSRENLGMVFLDHVFLLVDPMVEVRS